MSAIDSALRRVATIPKDILKQAFMPARYDPTRKARYYDNVLPLSLDACITDQVIQGRVMKDIDLVSGSEELLRLNEAFYSRVDDWNSIYQFSDEQTGGRTITSVFEVTYSYANNSMIGPAGAFGNYGARSSILLRSARDILTASGGVLPMSTAYVQIVGHNTILVNDVTPRSNVGFLRCQLTNDPNLNNLRPQYHIPFGTLVLSAVKSYVYTNLVIDIDEGMLRGGQTIGRFREVLDSYADAEQMYIDELDNWQKLGVMNDPTQHQRVLRLALGIRPKL